MITAKAASGAVTITNTELNDADLNGGSGSTGAAAVNVADVVYHLNELNVISVKNSSLEGGSVSLTTHQGNVTKNKDEAIHLQTVQAGVGALAIGVGYAGLTTKGQTGVAVEEGLRYCVSSIHYAVLRQQVVKATAWVQQGHPLSEALQMQGVFPADMIYMLKTGEASGDVERMLNKIAEYYRTAIENRTQILLTILRQ